MIAPPKPAPMITMSATRFPPRVPLRSALLAAPLEQHNMNYSYMSISPMSQAGAAVDPRHRLPRPGAFNQTRSPDSIAWSTPSGGVEGRGGAPRFAIWFFERHSLESMARLPSLTLPHKRRGNTGRIERAARRGGRRRRVPVELVAQRHHGSDDDDRWAAQFGGARLRRQGAEGGDDDPLVGARGVVDDRRRQFRARPAGDEFGRQGLEVAQAHVDCDRLARLQQRRPVEVDLAVAAVSGVEHAGLCMVAVGQGNAGIGRGADRRGHAWADLERNAVLGQRLDLLAASAEHEGIAAFQPKHPPALLGELDQKGADLLLRQFVIVRPLPDIDALGFAPD